MTVVGKRRFNPPPNAPGDLGKAAQPGSTAAPRLPWLNPLLAIVSVLVALLIGETAVRLFVPSLGLFPRFIVQARYDGATLRSLVPNAVFWHTSPDGHWEFRTNSQGFRSDQDYQYQKPAGRCRVLVLGDSNTEGYEVRQSATFSSVLDAELRADGIDAEVLNTGISGFGTAEELLFLEREGMKYRPNAVVLGFFDNDLEDNIKSGIYAIVDGKLVLRSTVHAPGGRVFAVINAIPGAPWLSQNSYLFSLFLNTAWGLAKAALAARSERTAIEEYAVRVGDISEYEWNLAFALLGKMKEVAHLAGVPLIIVEIPAVDLANAKPWLPSVPENRVAAFARASDTFIEAGSYLGDADRDIHVAHGQRHISEATHAAIAGSLRNALNTLKVCPANQ